MVKAVVDLLYRTKYYLPRLFYRFSKRQENQNALGDNSTATHLAPLCYY